MSAKQTLPTLDITLLGREYRVACPPEEREGLLAAAAYVDARMTDIAARTKSNGERLAVMTALNIAHELLTPKPAPDVASHAASEAPPKPSAESFDTHEFARRINSIKARLDAAMAEQDKLF